MGVGVRQITSGKLAYKKLLGSKNKTRLGNYFDDF